MSVYFKDLLGWLVEWNLHERPLQRRITAAILATVYCKLEDAGQHPRSAIMQLIDSGFLSDQLAELLHYAVRELDRLELEFEEKEKRLPNATELRFGAELAAEEELKRELASWDLPF